MSDPTGQHAQALQFLPGKRLFLASLEVRDIDGRADIAGKAPIRFETRTTFAQYGSILSVRPPQPIFQTALTSGSIRCGEAIQTAPQVAGMHTSGPPGA